MRSRCIHVAACSGASDAGSGDAVTFSPLSIPLPADGDGFGGSGLGREARGLGGSGSPLSVLPAAPGFLFLCVGIGGDFGIGAGSGTKPHGISMLPGRAINPPSPSCTDFPSDGIEDKPECCRADPLPPVPGGGGPVPGCCRLLISWCLLSEPPPLRIDVAVLGGPGTCV
jgi:hypothetical protein